MDEKMSEEETIKQFRATDSNEYNGEDGCDQIANPLLTTPSDNLMLEKPAIWENPYGGIYAAPHSSPYMYAASGSNRDDSPKQLMSEKDCMKYKAADDNNASCSDYKTEAYCQTNKPYITTAHTRKRTKFSQTSDDDADEMMVEAKKWMTKYSALKNKSDNQIEQILDYVDKSRDYTISTFEKLANNLTEILTEKIQELEKKIETKNN